MRSPGGEAKGILGHKILDREWGRVQVLEWVWGVEVGLGMTV